jgi:hypothetical protein
MSSRHSAASAPAGWTSDRAPERPGRRHRHRPGPAPGPELAARVLVGVVAHALEARS